MAEMGQRERLQAWFGVSRFDAGRAFFGAFYVFILTGWFPQLQVAYTEASRGTSLGVAVAVVSLAIGFAWGAGSITDILLVAAAAALGCGAGFALGAALTAELAAVRPFYASTLDRTTLETALWGEFIPGVVGAAIGGFAGALAATFVTRRTRHLGPGSGAIALLAVMLAAVVTAGLGAASIELVAGSVTAGQPGASINPGAIRIVVLGLSCLAAASAVLARRGDDGAPTIAITAKRVVAGVALIAVPVVVAGVYKSFVLEPF